MKKAVINLKDFILLSRGNESKSYIESKLKEAGFDLKKPIMSTVDAENMRYIYMQD